MFTVSNNMIYAKKPKVRQARLYESNKAKLYSYIRFNDQIKE